jgi:hypothetical protein
MGADAGLTGPRDGGRTAETGDEDMSVDRTHAERVTRYDLRDGITLVCTLTFGGLEDEAPTWKILLPGPGGTEDLYGTERFLKPGADRPRAWLAPIVGAESAAQLTAAVAAEPPTTSSWEAPGSD